MTTLTAPTAGGSGRYPDVPWRKLAWVTWRQHRTALAAAVALLAATCLIMLLNGLTARSHQLGQVACHRAGGCAGQPVFYNSGYGGTATSVALTLQILPGLIGVFLGGPLLAREFEAGTFRFAWTQECGRTRWLVVKLIPVAAMVTAAAAGLSLMTSWYLQPFINAGLLSGIRSPFFNVRGVDFAAWTLVAFAIATFTGAIVRRTVPAMAAGLAVWAGLFFATIDLTRPHYQAPLAGNAGSITVSWWIVGQSQGGAEVLYQPVSRFWTFQLIEGGWLFALAVALLAATVWLVNHRAG